MPTKGKVDNHGWAQALQQTKYPDQPGRAAHLDLGENVPDLEVRTLPAGFADRVHEQRVLTTPGVAEGFDRANEIIEGWTKSL